jgi:hypothetical protein
VLFPGIICYYLLARAVSSRAKGSYIEVLHRLHKATGAAGCIWRGIIKLESLEISERCQLVNQGTFQGETDFEAALPPLLVDILLTAWTR